MNETDVRIVQLEPLRVAAAHGFGAAPEMIAWEKIMAFVDANGLRERPGTRYFGFNNPNPSPGSPHYGYEQWVTAPEGVTGSGEVEIKAFGGGLYAVLRCTGIAQIGETWQQLVAWAEKSAHRRAHHQWLEEALTPPPVAEEAFVLDLYLPVASP